MPTIINLPKAAPPAPTYKVGQSVWFENDTQNPGADVRSGVITVLMLDQSPPKFTVESGHPNGRTVETLNLVLSGPGADIIYDAPPGKPAAPVAEAAPPAEPTPAPSTLPIPAIGSFIRYRDSTGICQAEVKEDAGDNFIWVLKPGNTKRTKVAISAIVAHPTDAQPAPVTPVYKHTSQIPAAPEVVTPTVEAPVKAAPAPAPAAPAPAAQTPAVRQAAPVATTEASAFDNFMGEVFDDPKYLEIPRFYIGSSGKVYEEMGALKGDIRIGVGMGADATDHLVLASMAEPRKRGSITLSAVDLAIIWVDGYWVEKIDYEKKIEKGLIPVIVHTKEELAKAQAESEWPFVAEARSLVMVKKPAHVAADHPLFPYTVGGEKFALAAWKIGGAASSAVFKPLKTRCSPLGGNKSPEHWKWELKVMLEDGKNIWAKPLLRGMGEWPAEMVEQFRRYIPKATPAVSEDDDHPAE